MPPRTPSGVQRKAEKVERKTKRNTLDIDEKDFLEMIMAEANEDEAAEVLGETGQAFWGDPGDESE